MSRLSSALDNDDDDDDGEDIKPHVKITFEYCYDGTEPAVIDIRRDALCPWCMQGTTTPRGEEWKGVLVEAYALHVSLGGRGAPDRLLSAVLSVAAPAGVARTVQDHCDLGNSISAP